MPSDIWVCSIEQLTKNSKLNGFLKKSDLSLLIIVWSCISKWFYRNIWNQTGGPKEARWQSTEYYWWPKSGPLANSGLIMYIKLILSKYLKPNRWPKCGPLVLNGGLLKYHFYTKSCIFTRENTTFGVHEWNKNQSNTAKKSFFLFFLLCWNAEKMTYFSPSVVTTEN